MLGVIKNQYIGRWSFSSNHTGILWHVTSPVNFTYYQYEKLSSHWFKTVTNEPITLLTFMVNFDFNLNFSRNRTKATKISLFAFIMSCIVSSIFIWKLNRCNKQMILLIRCMSSKNKTMNRIIFPFRTAINILY